MRTPFIRSILITLTLLIQAPFTYGETALDPDGNGTAAALEDGVLILRHLLGFTGSVLTADAIGLDATRDAAGISSFLVTAANAGELDADGDGETRGLTDGLLIVRSLFGFEGTELTSGVVASNATRTTETAINNFLATQIPVEVEPVTLTMVQNSVFTGSCALSGCHNSTGRAPRLASGTSFGALVNVSASQSSLDFVTPGDPDNSYLYRKIIGSGIAGSRMPIGGILNQTQTDLVRDWIQQGALNN